MDNLTLSDVRRYRNVLHRMLIISSKYGMNKDRTNRIDYLHIKKDGFLRPIVYINQDKNPYGEKYNPAKVVITESELYRTNILNPNLYNDSKSFNIELSTFKKNMKKGMKESIEPFDIEGYIKESNKNPSELLDIESVKLLNEVDRNFFEFNEDEIKRINESLNYKTTAFIKVGKYKIPIFYMNIPINSERLLINFNINILKKNIKTTVWLKSINKDTCSNVFYSFIDIWNEV